MTRRLDATILYNPTAGELVPALEQLARLGGDAQAVFDNSTDPSSRLLIAQWCAERQIPVLSDPAGNVGVAAALNRLLGLAGNLDCTWLHYLDQDSRVDLGYSDYLSAELDLSGAVAVGCRHHEPNQDVKKSGSLDGTRFLINSGTAFNVRGSVAVGGFAEQLFVDSVDTEFCLRVRQRGLRLAMSGSRSIGHRIGVGAVMIGKVTVTQHPQWRRIQMWRNSVLLCRAYLRHHPLDILLHLLVRVAETAMLSLRLASGAPIGQAAKGIVAGCREELLPPLSRHKGRLSK